MKMKRTNALIRFATMLFICALLVPSFAFSQQDTSKDKKKEKKEAKANKKDDERIDKQIHQYGESLAKAQEKYNKDSEFKDKVDMGFRKLQRDHAKQAFDINTFDSDDTAMTYSGDKIPKGTDTLYDNFLAQDYVNRVGQSLVPASSNKRYGFKITVDPMPDARSLSTGTVYISTGLLSLVDNEAQLAYILSHEIAHIEMEHWKQDVLVAQQIEDESREQEKKANIIGGFGGGLLGIFGGRAGGAATSAILSVYGANYGALVARYITKLVDNKGFEWALAQENEADNIAMQYMLDRNYDVRESQTFYETLRKAALEDPRIELQRFGDRNRIEERLKATGLWIAGADTTRINKTVLGATNLSGKSLSLDRNIPVVINRLAKNQEKMADEMKLKLQNSEIMAGDGEFENLMSAIKRDNGIVAFYYDMYKLAERNLSQALAIRSDDAIGYFFYGKVLKLTARKVGEKDKALQMFAKAIELDKRNANPQARLYYAMTKMSGRTTNNIQEIVNDLKQYVSLYQQMNGGALPPSMNVIYDYMQEAGEQNWSAFSYTSVQTSVSQAPSQSVDTPASDSTQVKKKRP